MTAQLIIDSDSHVTEPRDVWTSRVPSRYVDDVPHVERQDDGTDVWVLQGQRLGALGVTAPAGWPDFPPNYPPTLEDVHPGAHDAHARLRYMDEAGIWAQVLYPNVGGFGSEVIRQDLVHLGARHGRGGGHRSPPHVKPVASGGAVR